MTGNDFHRNDQVITLYQTTIIGQLVIAIVLQTIAYNIKPLCAPLMKYLNSSDVS